MASPSHPIGHLTTLRRPLANPRDVLAPFRVALSGLVHTWRTQRHMRVHIYVTVALVLGAIMLGLQRREFLLLLFMINFVLVAEMFNSAIEATVDLVSPNYHPLAKFAKDIAAGAVLVTTFLVVIIGVLVAISDDAWERIRTSLISESPGLPPTARIVGGCAILFFIVIIGKGLGRRGTILRGGLVSGHSAFGFFLATSILWISNSPLAAGIAFVLAAIIAQSRWEAKIHTIAEISLGGLVGVILSLLVFGTLPK